MKLKQCLAKAQKNRQAIGQFNFSSLEQLRGIIEASRETNLPVILGTSEGEAGYIGLEEAVALVKIYRKRYGVDAFLNLDHGKDFELLKNAIKAGYDAVHFDGSLLPYEENLKITKKLVSFARFKGVAIEAELGHIGGESSMHNEKLEFNNQMTDPSQVSDFVRKTGIDSLAIAIGTTHGIYKSEPRIDFERLKQIKNNTNAFLVLHGGSGVPDEDIKKAIEMGIVKININTELRVVWRDALKSAIIENSEEVKPYKILPKVIDSIASKVVSKIKLFQS